MEAEFRHQRGVIATAVGYSGGRTTNPTYESVCGHETGHAESVMVEFDPRVISYDRLLEIFWSIHDPTTPAKRGDQLGGQYRSAIFYHSARQKARALAARDRLDASNRFGGPIGTEIVEAQPFYLAEDYHQQYAEKHGGAAACRVR